MELPTPNPAFRWTREAWGHALRCEPLEVEAQHLFTSKQLQLPSDEGWRAALDSCGAAPSRLIRVKQVHGNAVRVVPEGAAADASASRPDGDAIVSNAHGFVLAVMVADCVPILVADRRRGVAAAIHAGWRGTCARVAQAAITAMQREFGSAPADLVAAVGPSAGPADYEVGESLIDAFRSGGHSDSSIARWFARSGPRPHLDLWTANGDQLQEAGVPPAHIFICGLSTVSHPEIFDSYRVSGERAGRMAALITSRTRHGSAPAGRIGA